jgi:hypothetical protein
MLYVLYPFMTSLLTLPHNYTWRMVQVMKLLIMQFAFRPLRTVVFPSGLYQPAQSASTLCVWGLFNESVSTLTMQRRIVGPYMNWKQFERKWPLPNPSTIRFPWRGC